LKALYNGAFEEGDDDDEESYEGNSDEEESGEFILIYISIVFFSSEKYR
jgi:hypothetical protein